MTEVVKKKRTKWTESAVKLEANKYEYRSDFKRENSPAYKAAIRLGILDEVCAHTVRRAKWTEHAIQECARTYKHRVDFKRGNESAYTAAR